MDKPCNRCIRNGLPIFPVLYAAVPNEAANGLPVLAENFGKDVVDKKLSQSSYVLRGVEPGYLYFLYPNNVWKGYLIDVAGYPRYYPDLLLEDMPNNVPEKSDVVACESQGKRHTGVEAICIEFPERIKGPVYIAYSRHKWTKAVRARHAKNPGSRMQQVISLDGAAFAHAEVATVANMQKWVADFHPEAVARINQYVPQDTAVRNRSGKAESLSQAMLAMSSELKQQGLIMALHDPIGLTMAVNRHRTRLAAKLHNAAGGNDPDRARKRVVAELIEGIRLNAEANPGPVWDRNYGPERFLKHIDTGAWKAALTEAKAVSTLQTRIKQAGSDYVQWKESPQWKDVQAHDFDAKDDTSAKALENMVAHCVVGSGLIKEEREKVWDAVLKLPADSPDHWFNRALAVLNPDWIDYVGKNSREDRLYDLFNKTSTEGKLFAEESVKEFAALYAAFKGKREATQATAALIDASSAILMRLRKDNPEGFKKVVRAVTATLITRADVVPQPTVVRGTASKIAAAMFEAANVKEVPGGAPVQHKPLAGNPGSRKGNFGAKAWELAEAANAEVVFKAPNTEEEIKTTVAWVLARLKSGATLNKKLLTALGLRHADLTTPGIKTNPFLENQIVRLSAKADIVLSSGTVFFQIYAMSNSFETFKSGDTLGGGVGMTTASLALAVSGLEIASAVQVLLGNRLAAATLLRWAGHLTLVAGVIEGGYLVNVGRQKLTRDPDSAWWTMGSGIVVMLGWGAAAGAYYAGAAGLAGGAAVFLGIPLWGWLALTIVLLGAALYMTWQAWATDDENLLPVEYWLDNGTFGKRNATHGKLLANNPYQEDKAVPPFKSLMNEIKALQKVLFVVQGRAWAAGDRHGFSIVCNYDVAIPRYEAGSKLKLAFTVIDEGVRTDVGAIICQDGESAPKVNAIHQGLKGMRDGPHLQLDPQTGVLRVRGFFSTMRDPLLFGLLKEKDRIYADEVEMKVSYWPDEKGLPDLVSMKEAIAR